jgi:hypothetical protein
MQNPMLFAHVVAFSSIVTYFLPDPVNEGNRAQVPKRQDLGWLSWLILRSMAVATLVYFMPGRSISLASVVFVTCFVLPYARRYVVPNSYAAELEAVAITVFLISTYVLTSPRTYDVQRPQLSFEHSRLVAILLITSVVLAMLRGGTYVVRGILRRTESLPKKGIADDSLDETEINRGRIIGHLERIILMIVVAKGSYEALGFLIAAKGLIRSEHFSNRDWAEYFLIGSLASVLIAVLAGWSVAVILRTYWT